MVTSNYLQAVQGHFCLGKSWVHSRSLGRGVRSGQGQKHKWEVGQGESLGQVGVGWDKQLSMYLELLQVGSGGVSTEPLTEEPSHQAS